MAYRDLPPHNGTATSLAAALEKAGSAESDRRKVLEFIASRSWAGATDEEIVIGTGIIQNTERPRRRELVLMGDVIDSGKTRKTFTGRQAVVWVLRTGQLRLL